MTERTVTTFPGTGSVVVTGLGLKPTESGIDQVVVTQHQIPVTVFTKLVNNISAGNYAIEDEFLDRIRKSPNRVTQIGTEVANLLSKTNHSSSKQITLGINELFRKFVGVLTPVCNQWGHISIDELLTSEIPIATYQDQSTTVGFPVDIMSIIDSQINEAVMAARFNLTARGHHIGAPYMKCMNSFPLETLRLTVEDYMSVVDPREKRYYWLLIKKQLSTTDLLEDIIRTNSFLTICDQAIFDLLLFEVSYYLRKNVRFADVSGWIRALLNSCQVGARDDFIESAFTRGLIDPKIYQDTINSHIIISVKNLTADQVARLPRSCIDRILNNHTGLSEIPPTLIAAKLRQTPPTDSIQLDVSGTDNDGLDRLYFLKALPRDDKMLLFTFAKPSVLWNYLLLDMEIMDITWYNHNGDGSWSKNCGLFEDLHRLCFDLEKYPTLKSIINYQYTMVTPAQFWANDCAYHAGGNFYFSLGEFVSLSPFETPDGPHYEGGVLQQSVIGWYCHDDRFYQTHYDMVDEVWSGGVRFNQAKYINSLPPIKFAALLRHINERKRYKLKNISTIEHLELEHQIEEKVNRVTPHLDTPEWLATHNWDDL